MLRFTAQTDFLEAAQTGVELVQFQTQQRRPTLALEVTAAHRILLVVVISVFLASVVEAASSGCIGLRTPTCRAVLSRLRLEQEARAAAATIKQEAQAAPHRSVRWSALLADKVARRAATAVLAMVLPVEAAT